MIRVAAPRRPRWRSPWWGRPRDVSTPGNRPDRLPPPPPEPVQLDLTRHEQRMDGFGVSSAWTASNITDAEADLLFSPTTGAGLSFLRVQIKPAGNTTEMGTARKAFARGAAVWAAPWSPPGEWKTNNSATNGGSLLPEHWQDWADRLATFAQDDDRPGRAALALSVQNEPNYTATRGTPACGRRRSWSTSCATTSGRRWRRAI